MDNSGLGGAFRDPELMDTASDKAQQLLDELKEKVSADVKDIGTLRKELTITVPADVIASQIDHNFDELRHDAVVPGFRKGRAPRALIEKRFGQDVRQSLKTAIIGQAYYAVVEKNEIEALGDPVFRIDGDEGVKLVDIGEALQHFTLPEEGDFVYACEIEVKPEFELPDLKGVEISTPDVEITDTQIDEQIDRHRKIRGRYELVADGAADTDDVLIADAKLSVDGAEVKSEDNVHLGVRPTRLDGVLLENLGEVLKGAKSGDVKTTDCVIPDDYERVDVRGKKAAFEFVIHEVKRLAPAPVDKLFPSFGVENEEQLRKAVRDDLEAEKEHVAERAKREQVHEYLLANTKLDLPEQLSARQSDRAVIRQIIELRQRGVPDGDIEAKIDELRTSAKEQVARDLKLDFILEKVAEQLEIDVTDEEVNTQIAMMARMYNRRFDRVRDELEAQGVLGHMANQIRQRKCVDKILEDAKLVEVKGK